MRALPSVMICLWGFACAVSAQTPPGNEEVNNVDPLHVPAGILIKQPGDFSAWEITYDYSGGTQKNAPEPKVPPAPVENALGRSSLSRVTVTFTKPVWNAVVEDVDGRKISEWGDPNGQFISGPYVPFPMQVPVLPTIGLFVPNFSSGFPDLGWVSKATYVGVQKLWGYPCLAFKQGDMMAWVDPDTRYPIRWQRGNEVRMFKQLPPPQTMLTMPKEIEKVSQGMKRDRELLNRPVPRGG